MFLTRAFEIINKEGVLTFRYALGQKMRENMTDEKIYQLYILQLYLYLKPDLYLEYIPLLLTLI